MRSNRFIKRLFRTNTKGRKMKELSFNTAVTLTKKDIIKYGVQDFMECMLESLKHNLEDAFTDLLAEDFKEEGNNYALLVTLQKIEPIE